MTGSEFTQPNLDTLPLTNKVSLVMISKSELWIPKEISSAGRCSFMSALHTVVPSALQRTAEHLSLGNSDPCSWSEGPFVRFVLYKIELPLQGCLHLLMCSNEIRLENLEK